MPHLTYRVPAVLLVALALLLTAACQQPAPPTPTPTLSPTSTFTPQPTVTPAPTATPRPTATPTVRPTATSRPVASAPGRAVSPGGADGGNMGIDEAALEEAMAGMIPTMMALFPTVPPVPQGQTAILSMEELEGMWEGWVSIDAVTISGMTPEDAQACEEQLAMIEGKQLPMGMDFYPESDEHGTVLMINEQQMDPDEVQEPVPYRYSDGVITIEADEAEGMSRFEGRTIQTGDGPVISGTWTSQVTAGEELLGAGGSSADSGELSIEGRWGLTRSPVAIR